MKNLKAIHCNATLKKVPEIRWICAVFFFPCSYRDADRTPVSSSRSSRTICTYIRVLNESGTSWRQRVWEFQIYQRDRKMVEWDVRFAKSTMRRIMSSFMIPTWHMNEGLFPKVVAMLNTRICIWRTYPYIVQTFLFFCCEKNITVGSQRVG